MRKILLKSLFLFSLFAVVCGVGSGRILATEKADEVQEPVKWGFGSELLGATHFLSTNVFYRHNSWLMFNSAFSYILIPGAKYNADFFIVPLLTSVLLGNYDHSFELVGGPLLVIPAEMGYRTADRTGTRASTTSQWLTPTLGAGYLYWPKAAGWFFRATGYTIYGRDPVKDVWNFRFWGGLTLGRTF